MRIKAYSERINNINTPVADDQEEKRRQLPVSGMIEGTALQIPQTSLG